MAEKTRHHYEIHVPRPGGVFSAGCRAGLFSGSISLILGCILSAAMGMGVDTPLRLVAGVRYGVNALILGPSALITGAVLYFTACCLLGIVFAGFVKGSSTRRSAFWTGLVYGFAIWAMTTYALLPAIDPVMSARVALTPGVWLLQCLIFGGLLYQTPVLRRRAAQRVLSRTHHHETTHVG
jgi:hypothetical protein